MGPQGPHAPQGAFLGPLGPQGPLRGHRGTQGKPPEPPRGSGSIFGTPRILASRRPPGDLPAAGLPAALPAWRRPLEAWRRPALGILADELARFCDMAGFFEAWRRLGADFERPGGGLAAAAAGLAAAPSPCLRFSWYASGGFFPAKNAFFGKKVTCTLKKKVLREGSPEPGTYLDRRGP